ncbi:xanthine dehydrogenase-like isoform X2 [Arctopsyche grandis]|uniref:xanthine dehydrogenase-like isoform X2 n=1 Tax=Arctopsyche grandis TaxID=121162 RepID=UPI00406D63D4
MSVNESSSKLIFFVNGKKIEDENPDPEWTLLYYLRKKLDLCGTKLGCADGGCGACTVMVSIYDHTDKKPLHLAVNACLAPVCSMHGLAVTTVEGIGSTTTRLHPVQERIAKSHGSQCGFCTPGIVMSMYTLLRSMRKPSYSDLEVAFQGNLCRCTGYRPIIEGYKTFIEDWESNRTQNNSNACGMGEKCCKVTGSGCTEKLDDKPGNTFNAKDFIPYDPSQEPIFPPELALTSKYNEERLVFKGANVTWYRPTSLNELLQLKNEHKNAKIVTGNTEVGVEVKFKNCLYPIIIMPAQVEELKEIQITDTGVTVGASVTLTDLENSMKNVIRCFPIHKTRIYKEIVDMLYWFAGKQIRNVASVGGNIMTGSPISDLNPIFMAAGVVLNFKSVKSSRKVVMDESFFTSYRKNMALPEEVLVSIDLPFTEENQYFKAYKQAKRREDDIAIVNMALNVKFTENNKISSMKLSFGGMGPVTMMAINSCRQIVGKQWNDDLLHKVYSGLLSELNLDPSAPGGMIRYRQSLTLSLFFKAFVQISDELSANFSDRGTLDDRDKSAIGGFEHSIQKSSQYFNIPINPQSPIDPVGYPIPHVSAAKQATGEAVFCDDMPLMNNELFLALVQSTRAHANILSIDPSEALSMAGVVKFFSASDLDPQKNIFGIVVRDEEIFVSKTVTSQGQIIGAIVAKDQAIAQKAAKAVKISYEDLKPIITIEDAIKSKSYFPGCPKTIIKGDVDAAFKNADHIIENEFRMGGQEHFYLETQTSRAVPKKEDNEMEIFCSLQHPTEMGKIISNVLGIPINRINMRVKRVGGGFGGKESRSMLLVVPVALAAHKLQQPVRCMLDRDEDMIMTGNRHPFYFKYKIAVKDNGKIDGAIIEMYNNGGYCYDLSAAVLERAMLHCENAYYIPNLKIVGYMCKTNLPSNTVFRGSGSPQGMLLAENYIRDIAVKLNMDPIDVTYLNLYEEGQTTHYNQTLTHCTLKRCWEECLMKSDYVQRKEKIEQYNKDNKWKKRGICILPTKFGVAFTVKALNQGGALIHVYTDGSVLLTHGGIEMGQGLHTKMIQIASRVLNIETSKIYISETATDKVPNTSPTAASVSSDLNGMAVLNACTIIMERLTPYIKENPTGKWEDWILSAYSNCTSLSAVGYYYHPHTGYDLDTNIGIPYNYYTYGVGCSEVEINCLTGDHRVLRTDIVMDVGESLNPAIDIGQIEGAFVQGYGLYTMEELIYSPTGTLYSRGPGSYKIPGFNDIPKELNVSLLRGAPNPRAIYSSKAVGEPPLFLAASVFFAIKNAISMYRKQNNASLDFNLSSPATVEKIRLACEDHITEMVKEQKTSTPWNIIP